MPKKDNKISIKESILKIANDNNLDVSLFNDVLNGIMELEEKKEDTETKLKVENIEKEKATKELEELKNKQDELQKAKEQVDKDLQEMKLKYIERFENGKNDNSSQSEDKGINENIGYNELFEPNEK